MEFTFTFLKTFLIAMQLGAPLFCSLIASILVLGMIVGRMEKWGFGDAIYWSFVTATTVGYGDYRPARGLSRFLAILIAVHGLILFAILGAIAVQATLVAVDMHIDLEAVKVRYN